MAPLTGKLVSKTKIVSSGDVFHELWSSTPHHVANISPEKVQGCDLHEGDFGKAGSIICWRYVHEGKKKIAKQVIETIDEENKSITFKMLEGDLMELYKSFLITIHVDTKGEDNLVTWTLDYEKLHEDVEDPNSFMEFLIHLTKDIESHHLQ
ncbi:Kirola [Heracleum sosnowskyi]|uniref:Kirola n=1 Tax=Heracleum sosnowskyi TaxID=360622 RepID=A0AAD8MPS4_9APIA|nr:Kirola [Heracleum sosnowskyi]